MLIRAARQDDLPAMLRLLESADLPIAGVADHLNHFFLAQDNGVVLSVAGLEVHGHVGLLRSVAVAAQVRSQGLAARLVREVMAQAKPHGLSDLYLLTTTAQGYFPRLGFAQTSRATAPPELLASREFQDACPQSATLMHLSLKEDQMTLTASTPNRTQIFLDTLAPHAGKPLIFQLDGETLVHEGYHVTEVKAVTIEAMDCGGRADAWRETVVQLWNAGSEEEQGFMTVEKFLDIYGKVARSVPVRGEAELRFEYGDARNPTIQYRVGSLDTRPDRVLVNLTYPAVSCKPNDERQAAGEAACCGPATTSTASTSAACCTPTSNVELVSLEEMPVASSGGCCG